MDAGLPFRVDARESDDFYAEALELARQLCARWGWPAAGALAAGSTGAASQQESDPGLVVFRVAALLTAYVSGQLNQVCGKYRLALYDFMGMAPRPATPARAPVRFELAPGAGPTRVPQGTTLSAQSNRQLVFSTDGELTALPLSIARAIVLDVPNGQYNMLDQKQLAGDTAGRPPELTRGARRLDHVLFLAGESYWSIASPCDLTVTFVGTQLTGEALNAKWFASGTLSPLVPRGVSVKGSSWQATFSVPSPPTPAPYSNYDVDPERLLVQAAPVPWLSLVPPTSLFAAGNPAFAYPFITRAVLSRTVRGVLPDFVFSNATKVNCSQGFYPFGARPKINDCLYIGSAALFSQQNLQVTLHLTVDVVNTPATRSGTPSPAQPETSGSAASAGAPASIHVSAQDQGDIAVETWDPDANVWTSLGQIAGAALISGASDVTITLSDAPIPGLVESKVNGQACHWLRLRLLTDVFGDPDTIKISAEPFAPTDAALIAVAAKLSISASVLAQALTGQGLSAGYSVDRPGAAVPYFRALRISQVDTWDSAAGPTGALALQAYNGFEMAEATGSGFRPFVPLALAQSTVALGMAVDGALARLAGNVMSFYVAASDVAEPGVNDASSGMFNPEGLDAQSEQPGDGSGGGGWRLLGDSLEVGTALQVVRDDTRGLTQAGLLQLSLPVDPLELRTSLPFGALSGEQPLLWLASPPVPVALRPAGVFLNAVEVEHSQTIFDETLGSATGEASQTFDFARKPLLQSPTIVVREPLHPALGEDGQLEVDNADGSAAECWVRWREVQSLTFAGPRERCYTVDYVAGTITFGDNVRGMTPPAGTNNIVARRYQSGGGAEGNVAAGDIARLRLSIAGIKSVKNPEAAAGGTDSEGTSERFLQRSARALKTQQRAVCAGDFAGLSLEAAPEVAFATTLTSETDILRGFTVAIVSYEGSDKRMPTPGLLSSVRGYLQAHMSMTQRALLTVVGPEFRTIAVRVTAVISRSAHGRGAAAIQAAVSRYLNPITGGDEGTGWGFQAVLHADRLRAVLAALPEVRSAKLVMFDDRQLLLRMVGRELPWPPARDQLSLSLVEEADA